MIEATDATILISSNKVVGAAVYNKDAENIGKIDDLMIDRKTGQAAYAVLSFGGFLGVGADYYPIPWRRLVYNSTLGGYVVDITPTQLESAPSFTHGADPEWGSADYEAGLQMHYGVGPYRA
jgi:sporulation protein YlmC with PRC-barrel domain